MSSLPGRLEPSQENAFDTATTDAVDHRRLRTRQLGTTLPPLDALWSFRRREATDTNVLKAMRASIVWRGADAWDALRIAARYSRWVRVPVLVSRALLAEGKDARRRFGRSLPGQAADVTRVATVNGLTPDEYYAAGLARYGGGDEILHYLPFDLIRACAYRLSGSWLDRIKDKLLFERTCRAAGLRVVRTITVAKAAGMLTPDGDAFAGALPDRDLILKPISAEQGRGVEMWRNIGPDRFSGADNGTLSSEGLARRASSLAGELGSAMLLQERLENHPDLRPIAGAALATTRIVTMNNERGEPEIVDSFYRTSIRPDAAVDNFHAGGMLFPVDITSGVLRPGLTDRQHDPTPITHHPETGARVAGVTHPGWTAMAELALRLHRLFPDLVMPGWDVGFDRAGPIAVEGNNTSAISINRQATFAGVAGTRTLALMAYHARRWLELNEPEHSRRRFARHGMPPQRALP
jgi:hypothetical protein